MKISTLVDANVLIDVLGSEQLASRPWSLSALRDCHRTGAIVFSAVVWAELSHPSVRQEILDQAFAWLRPIREDFPFVAARAAGTAHGLYRQRGGIRERTLPDFLIGAHAVASRHRLLTRDPTRYRSYFPDLGIIAPDTHP